MTMDEEQTKCNHQREQRVRFIIWQRTGHYKYTQNREEEVSSVERNFTRGKSMLLAAAEMHRRGIAHRR